MKNNSFNDPEYTILRSNKSIEEMDCEDDCNVTNGTFCDKLKKIFKSIFCCCY